MLLAPGAFSYGGVPPLFVYLVDLPLVGALFLHTWLLPFGRGVARALHAAAFYPDPVPAEYDRTMQAFTLRPEQFRSFASEAKWFGPGLRAMAPRYGEIQRPLVIVAGAADHTARPDRHAVPLHQAIAHAKLVMLEGTGHEVHYKHPEAVVQAVHDAWDFVG